MKFTVTREAGVDYAGEHYKKGDQVDIRSAHVVGALLQDKAIRAIPEKSAPKPTATGKTK